MNNRQNEIMEIIKSKSEVSMAELALQLHYSESTIRRDLIKLENLNLLHRVQGGAVIADKIMTETKTTIKSNINHDKKEQLADYAIKLINDYNTVFLDSSSTVYLLGKKIMNSKLLNLKIYTTNLVTALELTQNKKIQVYTFPGLIQDDIIIQNYYNDFFNSLHFDIAFFSCKSFCFEYGSYEILEFESFFKKRVSDNSEINYLLLDDTKFHKKNRYKTIEVKNFNKIITNKSEKIQNDCKKLVLI